MVCVSWSSSLKCGGVADKIAGGKQGIITLGFKFTFEVKDRLNGG